MSKLTQEKEELKQQLIQADKKCADLENQVNQLKKNASLPVSQTSVQKVSQPIVQPTKSNLLINSQIINEEWAIKFVVESLNFPKKL